MKDRIKGLLTRKKLFRFFKIALIVIFTSVVFLSLFGTVAHATGLVDDTVNADNLYSQYPLENYQLDFYVDNSWGWLPWNWLDGIGKSVQYGLYCITNFIWTISLYLSNATGYVVQQAYKLDFINDMADSIGKSIQTLAGVTKNGFGSTGFYVGFLLLIILVVGIYVAYTGLIKRETSKALHAVINFVVVFVLSASFIAYAPDYIKKINDFSSDISTASLDLGTKIMLPDSDSAGKDSVDLIRDSLFSIQVQQPWLLLQLGITLIVTVAFSISSMFYNISTDYPFFMIAFLQIVCFAGIYMKLGDLMSMFSLNAGDSQSMGRRIFRRPYMFMRHRARRMEHRIARAVGKGSMVGAGTGAMAGAVLSSAGNKQSHASTTRKRDNTSFGSRAGSAVGAVLDTKNKVKDKATAVKENIKDMPTQTAYALHSAKEKAKENVSDFKRGIVQGQETRQSQRADKLQQHRQNIADKRMELQKAQEAKQAGKTTDGSATTGATRPHDRPVTASPASKTDTGKVQEIKRPVTTDKVHTEPTKAQPVKERPLASKSTEPVLQKHGTRLNGVELNQQTTRKERNIKKATLNMTGKKGRKK